MDNITVLSFAAPLNLFLVISLSKRPQWLQFSRSWTPLCHFVHSLTLLTYMVLSPAIKLKLSKSKVVDIIMK